MKNIIAFAGSNSKKSINKQLAVYASSLVKNTKTTVLDLNDFNLPLYGIDLEIDHGIPDSAKQFFEYIKSSDGIVLSLAEHNGVYSTAFKNLIDWLSRIEQKLFCEKPMLLMATSPGGRGGTSVLEIAKDRFPRHNANVIEVFSLPFFSKNFTDGKINDKEIYSELKGKVDTFQKAL